MSPLRHVVITSCLVLFPAVLAASPLLPNCAETVDALPMSGPFPSIEDYCKSEGADVKQCLSPPTECGATRGNPTAGETPPGLIPCPGIVRTSDMSGRNPDACASNPARSGRRELAQFLVAARACCLARSFRASST
jgi:hypothetical protein